MSEYPKQEWRIEMAPYAASCRIFVNGQPIYPHTVNLHMAVNQPTTLSLAFPIYGKPWAPPPTYQAGDPVLVEGIPRWTFLEIDGRRFRVLEMIDDGDRADGLF